MIDRRSAVRSTILALALSLAILGCENSTEPAAEGTLSLSAAYTAAPLGAAGTLGKTSGTVAEISISRARFVIRDIKFKSAVEDSLSFRTDPFVLDLALTGATQSVAAVPAAFGDYRRVEFDVHRVEQPEIAALPVDQQGQFSEFLAGQRYSIIIEGTFTPTGGTATPFTYRSKVDAKQKINLDPPLVIGEGTTEVNTTLLVSSDGWFRNQQGTLVDPTDTNNEGIIDENLKASIRVFKDNNRDGSKD